MPTVDPTARPPVPVEQDRRQSDDVVRVFVSYSHKDPAYLADDSLLGFLKGLSAEEGVEFWTDERITAGSFWNDEIRSRLATSDIALVLVSQAFLDSPYCTQIEIESFLDSCRKRGMLMFPVVLSPCEWERHAWLATRQFLPAGGETIEEHYTDPGKQKRLFLRIRNELRQAVRSVREARAATVAPVETVEPSFAEKRQVTFLRCDLLPREPDGSPLDPGDASEVLHELMPEYDKVTTKLFAKYNGHVVGTGMGGTLVCFGYPDIAEDDSRRAVRAGLELVTRVGTLSTRFEAELGVALATRVAVHTGTVVTTREHADEDLSRGDAPMATMYLQQETEPGSVVVTAATLRLVEPFFEVEPVGSIRVPGATVPVAYSRIVADKGFETRFEATASQTLTPIVGRDREMDLLLDRWQSARRGSGGVVMLCAEAGVGKSRLLKQVRERVAEQAHTWLEWRCSPYYRDSALHPVVEALKETLGITHETSDRDKLQRIRDNLATLDGAGDDLQPYLAHILGVQSAPARRSGSFRAVDTSAERSGAFRAVTFSGQIPIPQAEPSARASPQEQKQHALEAVAVFVELTAMQNPVVLVVEDLHWIDPTTVELLDLIVEQAPGLPLLVLLTYRPEYAPPPRWMALECVSQLALTKLDREDVEKMILHLAGGKPLPQPVTDEIFAKTDGFPLFVEDLTRMVIESDLLEERNGAYELVGPFQSLSIPATLYETIMARLAKLATAKPVAQLGATIGREFVYDMLRAVASLDDQSLKRELDRLVTAGLLYRRGLLSRAKYIFKHALVQEALHESLLKRQRKQYHKLVAEVLEEKFPNVVRDEPELVARHFVEAGIADKAASYYFTAAQRALASSSNSETLAHAANALTMIEQLPPSEERWRMELDVRCVQGSALVAVRGWASKEMGECYARARELSDQLPGAPRLVEVLKGQCSFNNSAARLGESRALGAELLRIAKEQDSLPLELEALGALCFANFWGGQPQVAVRYGYDALMLYDPGVQHLDHVERFGEDPGAPVYTFLAMSLAVLGLEDQARQINEAAEASYDVYTQMHSRCYILAGLLFTALQTRDAERIMEVSTKLLAIAEEYRYPTWIGIATPMRGWALTTFGEIEQGVALIKAGRDGWRATGGRLHSSQYPALIAEAYMSVGRFDEAAEWLETGFKDAAECTETYYSSELWRLKGELSLLMGSSAADAEASYARSLAIAREQEALTFELRTEVSACELLRQTDPAAAGARLQAVMARFTEGFGSWDMKRAKALMERLG
ncbi:MAG TPA: AAA family ATPase [Thermoanaerobaculia bacterium]|nr:AAA family ATPase [Thermoanaerobaculia bacterium]